MRSMANGAAPPSLDSSASRRAAFEARPSTAESWHRTPVLRSPLDAGASPAQGRRADPLALASLLGNRRMTSLVERQPAEGAGPGDHVVSTWLRERAGVSMDRAMPPEAGAHTPHEREADRVASGAHGEGLPATLRGSFEPRMHADLADVRVHTDPSAGLVAQTLGARAFAVGRHVAFAPGEYRPGTADGRRLIAHEVAHVLQQHGGPAARERAEVSESPVRVAAKGGEFKKWTGIVATEKDALMVRTQPDPASEARGKLPKDSEVEVVGGHPLTWLIVNGTSASGVRIEKGYVLGRFIKPKPVAAAPPPKAAAAPPPPARDIELPASAQPPELSDIKPPQVDSSANAVANIQGLNKGMFGSSAPGIMLPMVAGVAQTAKMVVHSIGSAIAKLSKDAVVDAVIAALRAGQRAMFKGLRGALPSLPASAQGPVGSVIDAAELAIDFLITALIAVFGIVTGAVEGVVEMIEGIAKLVWTIIALVGDFVTGLWSQAHREAFDERVKGIITGFKNLPQAFKKTIDDWIDRFNKAPLDKGSFMIGELTGRIIALIASFMVGGEIAAAIPKVTVPTFALVETTAGTLQVVRVGTTAVSLATPGVAVGLGAGGVNMMTTGSGSSDKDAPKAAAKVKGDPKAMKTWKDGLPTKDTPGNTPKDLYEIKHTGSTNYQASGGGEKIWVDGMDVPKTELLEAKFISKPGQSPFINNGSGKIPDGLLQKMIGEVDNEFMRYGKIIGDADVPASALRVIVNDAQAKPFFEALMKKYKIPGVVEVRE